MSEPTRTVSIYCFGEAEPSLDRETMTESQISKLRNDLADPAAIIEIRRGNDTRTLIPSRAVSAVFIR